MMRPRTLAVLLALVLSVPALYLAEPAQDATAAPSVLRIGFLQKIDSLNPYVGVSDTAYVFYGLVYDTLTCVDNHLNVTSNLALTHDPVSVTDPYMVSNGLPYGSVWEYDLTTKAYWTDGHPMDAVDVCWSINLNAGNYTDLWAFQPYAYFMKFAFKVDDHTVRIVFYDRATGDPKPASYADLLSIYILPEHKMQNMSAAKIGYMWPGVFDGETPPIVGTGPFIPTSTLYNDWLAGNPITLTRNPNYFWGPQYGKYVNFDQIRFNFYDDTLAMQYALTNGGIDVAQFPPQPYRSLRQQVDSGAIQNIQTFDGPKPTSYWTDLLICQKPNSKNPSRLDPIIEHALAMATNKTYITENFYLGLADIGTTMIAPINTRWHYEPTGAEIWQFDLQAAGDLLQSNGYIDTNGDGIRECTASSPAVLNNWVPEGTPLQYEMLLRAEHPEEKEIGRWLHTQWNQIGVDFNYIVVDEPTLTTIVYSYEYDMAIWYWSSDIDPNYQLFEASSMAINGWNDIWYNSRAYDENYSMSVSAMDYSSRSFYVDNCQRIMYQDCSYIILAYPYQTYAWRTDTFRGWGDWRGDPGRSLDNFWSGNPLFFDLLPGGYNVTGPTNVTLTADPGHAVTNSSVTFNASAQHDFGYAIHFYIDFGDGTSAISEAAPKYGSQYATFVHAYDSPAIYTVTLWASDGLQGDEHNVSTTLEAPVEAALPSEQPSDRSVDYVWYDMFNVPFGEWWSRRWSIIRIDQPWTNDYPYIFVHHGSPPGNTRYYTNMRLNITGSGMSEINMNERPEFLPYFGTERGGHASIDWYMQYMTSAQILARIPLVASWNDGWFVNLKGTVTLDRQAAKAVLGITDPEFDNFAPWWSSNNATIATQWQDWITAQSSGRLDIHPMYDYDMNWVDFVFWCEKVGTNIVVHMDTISWGMEAMMTRWMRDSFMPTEWYFEDMNFHMWIGPEEAQTMIDTAVAYAACAWENRTTGDPCWVWQGMLQDYVPSVPPIHPYSAYDRYAPNTYFDRSPGSVWYHQNMTYDYVPGAWNLSQGETLMFQWPSGQQLYIDNAGAGQVANVTGNMSVGYAEPWATEFLQQVLLNPGQNTVTFVGPLDMWDWGHNQTTYPGLANEWSRVGLQPYGLPWIEFQDVERPGPYASFVVSPTSGNASVDFIFDASDSYDPEHPTGDLQFRWDFESDGIWDTGWLWSHTVNHTFATGGYYTVLLQARNASIGHLASTSRGVVVDFTGAGGHPPNALFTVFPGEGSLTTEFLVDASSSWDAEDPASALLFRWSWDVGGAWTPFTRNETASHLYDAIGDHRITLQVVDTSMRLSSASIIVTVFDEEGPVTNITLDGTLGSAGWYVTDAMFDFVAWDNWTYVYSTRYRIDGSGWMYYNGTSVGLSEGTHVVEFYSIDGFGNSGSVRSETVKVDKSPPWLHGAIANWTLGENGWCRSNPVIDFLNLSDNVSGVGTIRYREFGGSWQNYTGPFELQSTGQVLLEVAAIDAAGNQMPVQEFSFKIDPYTPIIYLDSDIRYNSLPVRVPCGVSENISGLDRIETSLDGGPFQNRWLETSLLFPSLSEGNHTLAVRAFDLAGNFDYRTFDFMLDTRAPFLSGGIISGTAGENGWFRSALIIDLSGVSDNTSGVAGIQYRLAGGSWQDYTGSFEMRSTGYVVLQFKAQDLAGNEMPTQDVLLQIDSTAPIVDVICHKTYNSSAVNISWTTFENLSGLDRIETSIDGGAFQDRGTTTSFEFTGLSDGSHTLVVRAIDSAGNVGEKTVSFTVQTETTPPPPAHNENLMYGLAGGAMGAIAAALIVLLVMRRRKGPQT